MDRDPLEGRNRNFARRPGGGNTCKREGRVTDNGCRADAADQGRGRNEDIDPGALDNRDRANTTRGLDARGRNIRIADTGCGANRAGGFNPGDGRRNAGAFDNGNFANGRRALDSGNREALVGDQCDLTNLPGAFDSGDRNSDDDADSGRANRACALNPGDGNNCTACNSDGSDSALRKRKSGALAPRSAAPRVKAPAAEGDRHIRHGALLCNPDDG
ncbi:MAG TPA: hypothetical protein VIG24_20045, partial [Acidimicrobiia bacterium]